MFKILPRLSFGFNDNIFFYSYFHFYKFKAFFIFQLYLKSFYKKILKHLNKKKRYFENIFLIRSYLIIILKNNFQK